MLPFLFFFYFCQPLLPDPLLSAIPQAPTFAASEDRFFVVSSVPVVSALATTDGTVLWEVEDEDGGIFTASPKVSSDDLFVYTTQANGKVASYMQETGTLFWSVDCASLTEDGSAPPCTNELAGEFSVSGDGYFLYFGDASGSIVALDLDSALNPPSLDPTSSPTGTPSYAPTEVPSDAPSLAPTFFGQTRAPTPAPTAATPSPTTSPTVKATDAPVEAAVETDSPTSTPTAAEEEAAVVSGAIISNRAKYSASRRQDG